MTTPQGRCTQGPVERAEDVSLIPPHARHAQVGLAEMKNAVELSGGLVIQTDSFNNAVFKESFRNLLAGPEDARGLALSSNATLEVRAQRAKRSCPELHMKLARPAMPAGPCSAGCCCCC